MAARASKSHAEGKIVDLRPASALNGGAMSSGPDDDPANDFGATTLDREAMSFEDIEALAEASEAPASAPSRREVSGPLWAGTLPGLEREPTPTPPPAAAPEPPPVAPPAPQPPDPTDLAATTLHQKIFAVEAPVEPPIDQLERDNRVAAAGRDAGVRPGAAGTDADDRWLKLGLAVIVALIVLLVLGVCAGVGSTLLEPEPDAASTVE